MSSVQILIKTDLYIELIYFVETGNSEETKKRALLLLRYHKRAGDLISSHTESHARSDSYDNFVLTNRDYLKNQLCLCEPAVQKILRYCSLKIFIFLTIFLIKVLQQLSVQGDCVWRGEESSSAPDPGSAETLHSSV